MNATLFPRLTLLLAGLIGTAGTFNFSPTDHGGLGMDAFAMLTVRDGQFVLLEN